MESDRNQLNNDDMTSNGSYIYPITSTTSLIHTSSPSSIFKSEQYAVIDWPTNKVDFNYESFLFNFVLRHFIMHHQISEILHRN